MHEQSCKAQERTRDTLNHVPIGAVYAMLRAAAGTCSTNVFQELTRLLLHSQHCCFQVPPQTPHILVNHTYPSLFTVNSAQSLNTN